MNCIAKTLNQLASNAQNSTKVLSPSDPVQSSELSIIKFKFILFFTPCTKTDLTNVLIS